MTVYQSITPEIKLKNKKGEVKKVKITSSDDCETFFREIFDEETLEVQEQMIIIYLNNSNNTVGWYKASSGSIVGTLVDVRLIMKAALECYATRFIVAHNHPSGALYPSEADKNITQKLKEAGKIMEITLVDHLILTSESYYSFANEDLI